MPKALSTIVVAVRDYSGQGFSDKLYTLHCIVSGNGKMDRTQKLYQRIPSRHVPICRLRQFWCRMYRLATKRTAKKRVEENASVSFFQAKYVVYRLISLPHGVRYIALLDMK